MTGTPAPQLSLVGGTTCEVVSRTQQLYTGTVEHETLKAGDLRERYLTRLAERKDRLTHLCRATGWQYLLHHTDASAQSALLQIYQSLDRGTT